MKLIISALALTLLAVSAGTTSAQDKPQVTTPSGQNSGAGIQGQPGNKNGPAAKQGTVGSASTTQRDQAGKDQDAAKVKGLPGNKSGEPVNKPQ